jgi:hypothetical protein
MARRKMPLPDTRPDWRDPNMPVTFGDFLVRPDVLTVFMHEDRMATTRSDRWVFSTLNWRNDPTYNLRGRANAKAKDKSNR